MLFLKIDNNVPYILKNKTPNIIKVWLLCLIMFVIITFIVFKNYEYYKCESYVGHVKVEKLYIYVKEDKVNLLSNSKLIIDKKEYSFKYSVSTDYYLVDDSNYYLVEIDTLLDDKYMIENNILNVILKYEKTTILKEIKKGMNIWKK